MGSCHSDALAWALGLGYHTLKKHGPIPSSPLIVRILQLAVHHFCEDITAAYGRGLSD